MDIQTDSTVKYHCRARELPNGDYELKYPCYFPRPIRYLRQLLKVAAPGLILIGLAADAIFTFSAVSGSRPPTGAIEVGLLSAIAGIAILCALWSTKYKILLIHPGKGIDMNGGILPLDKVLHTGFDFDEKTQMAMCWAVTEAKESLAIAKCHNMETANEVNTFLSANLGRA